MVLFPLSYGPLYLACLLFPGLCLNKWLSCLLVGFEVLGDIGRRLFGVLLSSLLCGTYGKNGTTKISEGEERSIIKLKRIFLLSLFEWRNALIGLDIHLCFRFCRFMEFWVNFYFPCTLPVLQGICFFSCFFLYFQ